MWSMQTCTPSFLATKILAVDSAVQTKIGLDQVMREDVVRLEQELGFVKGKLKELAEAAEKA